MLDLPTLLIVYGLGIALQVLILVLVLRRSDKLQQNFSSSIHQLHLDLQPLTQAGQHNIHEKPL